jgi:ABC-type multidrug transport system fused ATPase/permease subunit
LEQQAAVSRPDMERIEFSELTNRMHRNLVAVAAAIIVIVFFDIKIEKATTLGMEVTGLTTRVLLWILVAILMYHIVAFAMRAIEEFRAWELKLASRIATSYGGKIDVIELANQLRGMAEIAEKWRQSSSKDVISSNDVELIKATYEVAQIYAKRFKNFPTITRCRFWFWDIGGAALLAVIALGFAAYAEVVGR